MHYQRRALGCLLFVHALAAHAQPNAVLSGPAVCTQCRVELNRVVTFGDAQGAGMLQEQSAIRMDGRGRFYVSSNYDPTIAVFDSVGRFIRRIGRRGPGPGEFPSPPQVRFGARDTLYAVDMLRRRMAVFSPDYALVRTATLPVSGSHVVLAPDDRILISGAERFVNSTSSLFHLLDRKGALVRSFGSPTSEQGRYAPMSAVRRMAVPRGAHVWASTYEDYVLEQWSLEGRKLAQLTRDVVWFPPKVERPRGATSGTHPPSPWVRSITEDSAGLVWTLSSVPDRDWKPRLLPPMPGVPGATYTPDSLWHKINDSILEVIDPGRGVVLATQRFDTAYMDFIGPYLLVSFEEDAEGNPRYVVWRARLVAPSP